MKLKKSNLLDRVWGMTFCEDLPNDICTLIKKGLVAIICVILAFPYYIIRACGVGEDDDFLNGLFFGLLSFFFTMLSFANWLILDDTPFILIYILLVGLFATTIVTCYLVIYLGGKVQEYKKHKILPRTEPTRLEKCKEVIHSLKNKYCIQIEWAEDDDAD